MKYDFDTVLSRTNTDSIKWDRYGSEDVLPLWVADMDFPVAPEIISAMQKRLDHPVFGYTHPSENLTKQLIKHLDDVYGWEIQKDWILWLPGVVPGLAAGVRAYATPGSEIVTNPPIYHHFFQVHDDEKHQLVKVPLKQEKVDDGGKQSVRWTYDLAAMADAINDKTSLLMLCSPHNPTGTVFSKDELNDVCRLAQKSGTVVLSDEIHCGLVIDEDAQHIPTAMACPEYADSIVTLMSASKTFNLAGINCSYAIISNKELREQYAKACVEVIPMVGTFAYTAAEAAFEHGEPWRLELLEYLRGNYARLKEAFEKIPGMELHDLEATYLAWIDATELGLNDTCGFFERNGLGFSSGEQFGQPQYLRFNFACPRATLEEAISRIEKAVATL